MNAVDLIESIHLKILEAALRYRRCEAEMIDLIQQVDQHRVFRHKGYSSLFEYSTKALRLSENAAFSFIMIARKASEIPELKTEIRSGTITVSNARRIVPVVTSENKTEWILKAKTLTTRQLEKEIVKVRPQEATAERATYVSSERVKLELGLSEKDLLALRKVQDILSQKAQGAVSLEKAICTMTEDFLKRNDPIQRAKRQVVRSAGTGQPSKLVSLERTPIPAAVLHRVHLRDQRRCTHTTPDGKRCNQTRWLDIHHVIPVSEGGQNTLENLTTLCSTHHKHVHDQVVRK